MAFSGSGFTHLAPCESVLPAQKPPAGRSLAPFRLLTYLSLCCHPLLTPWRNSEQQEFRHTPHMVRQVRCHRWRPWLPLLRRTIPLGGHRLR